MKSLKIMHEKEKQDINSEMVYIYSRDYLAINTPEGTQIHKINVLPLGISILPRDFFF